MSRVPDGAVRLHNVFCRLERSERDEIQERLRETWMDVYVTLDFFVQSLFVVFQEKKTSYVHFNYLIDLFINIKRLSKLRHCHSTAEIGEPSL